MHLLRISRREGVDEALIEGARGLALMSAGKLKAAEDALVASLKIDPRLTGALYNLAVIRLRQGRIAEAAALIHAAWAYGYKNGPRLARDPELAVLRDTGLLQDILTRVEEFECSTY
jgi:Flp pilus assembly protein TadD